MVVIPEGGAIVEPYRAYGVKGEKGDLARDGHRHVCEEDGEAKRVCAREAKEF